MSTVNQEMIRLMFFIWSYGYAVYGEENVGTNITPAGEFFSSHSAQIDLTGVTRITTGVIYSPDYGSEYYEKLGDHSVCTINISAAQWNGQHDSLLVFRTVRAGGDGPCLENTLIRAGVVKGECSEEQVIMGTKGIKLTIELGNHSQHRFHINFTVYPLVRMTHGLPQIYLDDYPEGYITDYQPHAVGDTEDVRNTNIELKRLPDIATITFSIEFINLTASRDKHFILRTRKSTIINLKESVTNFLQIIQINYSVDYYLRLVYKKRNLHMGGEYVRIKYKVENCKRIDQIPNLNNLHHSKENSSLYTASCDGGYYLLNGDRDYDCKNHQWIPEISCERKNPNEVNEQPTIMNTSKTRDITEEVNKSTNKLVIYGSALLLGVLFIILLIAVVFYRLLRIIRNERQHEILQAVSEMVQTLSTPMAREEQIKTVKANSISTTGYEVIKETDPYRDYQTLNEHDMLSNFYQDISDSTKSADSGSRCDPQSLAGDTVRSLTIDPPSSKLPSKGLPKSLSPMDDVDHSKPVFRKTPVPSRKFARAGIGIKLSLYHPQQGLILKPVGDEALRNNHIYCNIGEIGPTCCMTGHDIGDIEEPSKLTSELREPQTASRDKRFESSIAHCVSIDSD